MHAHRYRLGREGFALPLVLLISMAVTALSAAALMLRTNTELVGRYYQRQDRLGSVADQGLEWARAALNGDPAQFPDSAFVALESKDPVDDGFGSPIPNVTRSTYVGPAGITSGQYGIYGMVVSIAEDAGGAVAIRRAQLVQESFSKYAYFTDTEPSNIKFGSGDQIHGPVHSNDDIKIYDSGATFFDHVTTAGSVRPEDPSTAIFQQGYTENAPPIPLPETADLVDLKVQAQAGGTSFDAVQIGETGRAEIRIEFIAIDTNGDSDTRDEGEGFIRVYTSNDEDWVVGAAPVGDLRSSESCGHVHSDGTFLSANDHGWSGTDNWVASVSNSSKLCLLGGDPILTNGWQASTTDGSWVQWGGSIPSSISSRPDAAYLFPINRSLNPNFKGVIYVDGDVAISGTVRGRVTVAANGDIIIADDVRYATDPSLSPCDDILGLFANEDVVVANTPLNAPWQRWNSSGPYFSYDESTEEVIHAFVLALDQFWVEDYDSGSQDDEECNGVQKGRGCLLLTGGIVQSTRGAVGLTSGEGYLKRYSYDPCGATTPPPYFPTTGRFARGQYYDVDPNGFDITDFFDMVASGN